MSTEIPSAVIKESLELTRLLAEPSGRLYLDLMEQEVIRRIGRLLAPETSDEEALRERHVVMAITGMVERGLLDPVRLAQSWMDRKNREAFR